MHTKLKQISWIHLESINDVNDLYNAIESVFNKCYNDASFIRPNSCTKKKIRKKWMTADLLLLIQERESIINGRVVKTHLN